MVDQIELAAWTADWALAFASVARDLRGLLSAPASFEHVGSTAVPGLAAKPIVDILIGVTSLDAIAPSASALRAAGYTAVGCPAPEEAMFFQRDGKPPINIHLTTVDSGAWRDLLAFRDRIRTDPGVRSDYAGLKERLALSSRGDLHRYTEGKSAFIAEILRARP